MEPRLKTMLRTVSAEDLEVAERVADYYERLRVRNVYEPALSACTVAFQQAITKTQGDYVRLVIGEEDTAP